MSTNQARYAVQVMARTRGVSRSGFYAFEGPGPSDRDVADAVLLEGIKRVHKASKQTYGAPRIHAELADEGTLIGRKRVERLMQANGIVDLILAAPPRLRHLATVLTLMPNSRLNAAFEAFDRCLRA